MDTLIAPGTSLKLQYTCIGKACEKYEHMIDIS